MKNNYYYITVITVLPYLVILDYLYQQLNEHLIGNNN